MYKKKTGSAFAGMTKKIMAKYVPDIGAVVAIICQVGYSLKRGVKTSSADVAAPYARFAWAMSLTPPEAYRIGAGEKTSRVGLSVWYLINIHYRYP